MSEKTTSYLDPLTNFGFKHIFGELENSTTSSKNLLIKFLNTLFFGDKHILDVRYNNTGKNDQTAAQDYSPLLSLVCITDDEERFLLDIDHLEEHNFRDKNRQFITQYYNQLSTKKSNPQHRYREHYLLGFLKFKMRESLEYLHLKDICMLKMENKEVFSGTMAFKFLEFSNFRTEAQDLNNDLDKWLYLLKNLNQLAHMPQAFDTPVFKEVFQRAKISELTKEELIAYATSLA